MKNYTQKKHVYHFLMIISFGLLSVSANAQSMGLNNATPNASSILDLTATDRGILVPRMTSAQKTAIASPAPALLIYQTDGVPGFYYNAGTPSTPSWVSFLSTNSSSAVGTGGWSVSGNAGTTGANFLGTTDNAAFTIQTGTGALNIGTDAFAKNITLGNITGATTTNLHSGTGGLFINHDTGLNTPVMIGTGTTSGSISLGGGFVGTQVIGVGNNATAGAIKALALGNNITTSSTTLLSGTSAGVLALNATAGGALTNIGTGTTTGSVTIGNSANFTFLGSIRNTIGIASKTDGSGVRFGNGRISMNKPTNPTSYSANYTTTAAEILNAGIIVHSAAITITLPTAALLVVAIPGTATVGDVIQFYIVSTGNSLATLAAGTGGTIAADSGSPRQRFVLIRFTNVTAGSEAYSVYY